jgi:thioredoxin 1
MLAVTRDSYADEVLAASHARPVVVDFWGPRCGPCLAMMPWVEALADKIADDVKIVKLNSAENRRLCVELRVLGLPTFLMYRDGQEVRRLTGDACTPSSIADAIRDLAPQVSGHAALATAGC